MCQFGLCDCCFLFNCYNWVLILLIMIKNLTVVNRCNERVLFRRGTQQRRRPGMKYQTEILDWTGLFCWFWSATMKVSHLSINNSLLTFSTTTTTNEGETFALWWCRLFSLPYFNLCPVFCLRTVWWRACFNMSCLSHQLVVLSDCMGPWWHVSCVLLCCVWCCRLDAFLHFWRW